MAEFWRRWIGDRSEERPRRRRRRAALSHRDADPRPDRRGTHARRSAEGSRAALRRGRADPRAPRGRRHPADERHRIRRWLSDLGQDLRLAVRVLSRTPFFAVMAIASIGLGIGLSTTIFSAVNGILLRALPYEDADRLVAVYSKNVPRVITGSNIGWLEYVQWRDQAKTLAGLGSGPGPRSPSPATRTPSASTARRSPQTCSRCSVFRLSRPELYRGRSGRRQEPGRASSVTTSGNAGSVATAAS